MMNTKRFYCAGLLVLIATALLAGIGGQAPIGTYTALMGSSVVTGSVSAPIGTAGGAAKTDKTAGTVVNMNITGYCTVDNLKNLTAAQNDSKPLLSALQQMNFGSVTIGNQTYPINAAYSISRGSKNVIGLLSAKTFSKSGPMGTTGAALSCGFIELTVPSSGTGTGTLFTTTQVLFTSTAIAVRAGASTGTPLQNVKKI